MVYIFPSLTFYYSYTNYVEGQLLVQFCKGFANEQILSHCGIKKIVAVATTKVVNETLFLTF